MLKYYKAQISKKKVLIVKYWITKISKKSYIDWGKRLQRSFNKESSIWLLNSVKKNWFFFKLLENINGISYGESLKFMDFSLFWMYSLLKNRKFYSFSFLPFLKNLKSYKINKKLMRKNLDKLLRQKYLKRFLDFLRLKKKNPL